MKITKITVIILLITFIALSQVYLQTEIVKLGYQIKERQDQYQQLVDNNNVLKYNIFVLESPYNLEKNICLADSRVNIVRPSQVMNLYAIQNSQLVQEESQGLLKHPVFLAIKKFFAGRPAEAKPIK